MNADASNPALHFGSEVKRARVAGVPISAWRAFIAAMK